MLTIGFVRLCLSVGWATVYHTREREVKHESTGPEEYASRKSFGSVGLSQLRARAIVMKSASGP